MTPQQLEALIAYIKAAIHDADLQRYGLAYASEVEERKLREAFAPPIALWCIYEDCDQDPAPGSKYCAGHLEQESRLSAGERGMPR